MPKYINTEIVSDELKCRTYGFASPAGASGTYYVAGFYRAPSAHVAADQAGPTQTHGSANSSYAAFAFVVAGGAGVVAAGVGNQVGLRVTGTSITDKGVRTGSDTEVLTDDITGLALNDYLQTTKKWIGQITFELYVVGGAPATYSLNFNYGTAKFENICNKNFFVKGIDIAGRAGANDSGFNIELLHHKLTGWTYDAAAFVPGTTVLASMNSDHVTEKNLVTSEDFGYKRDNLGQFVASGNGEGILFRITTGANKAVEAMDLHLGYISF